MRCVRLNISHREPSPLQPFPLLALVTIFNRDSQSTGQRQAGSEAGSSLHTLERHLASPSQAHLLAASEIRRARLLRNARVAPPRAACFPVTSRVDSPGNGLPTAPGGVSTAWQPAIARSPPTSASPIPLLKPAPRTGLNREPAVRPLQHSRMCGL